MIKVNIIRLESVGKKHTDALPGGVHVLREELVDILRGGVGFIVYRGGVCPDFCLGLDKFFIELRNSVCNFAIPSDPSAFGLWNRSFRITQLRNADERRRSLTTYQYLFLSTRNSFISIFRIWFPFFPIFSDFNSNFSDFFDFFRFFIYFFWFFPIFSDFSSIFSDFFGKSPAGLSPIAILIHIFSILFRFFPIFSDCISIFSDYIGFYFDFFRIFLIFSDYIGFYFDFFGFYFDFFPISSDFIKHTPDNLRGLIKNYNIPTLRNADERYRRRSRTKNLAFGLFLTTKIIFFRFFFALC